ncbi:PPE domain-containing protein [Actinosynnema sp. NPDC023587]|uniref:PPE family protein n=1 Tax=Actinosynnema sp. NPDC023587 TaxID=3154695 RepID=UPI003406DBA7
MGIREHNFDAQSHRQLYDKIHGGPGHSAVRTVDDAWNNFRAVVGDAKANLESAIRDAKAVWVGAAGERFSGSSAPLVQWAEDLRVAGVTTHHAFSAQTSYYGSTKTAMPEPVQVTSTANDDFLGIPAGFKHLVGGQTDQDIQEQAANEAKREAVRVMQGYRNDAASAVDALGEFVPPPQVVAQVSEPTFEQSQAHEKYTPQFSDTRSVDSTSTARREPAHPPVAPPPAVSTGDNTQTSVAQPPADVAPRPTPSPTPSPSPTPPPGSPPVHPPFFRPNPNPPGRPIPPTRLDRPAHRPGPLPPADAARYGRDLRAPSGSPTGGPPNGGTPRFGGGLPGLPGQPGAGAPGQPGAQPFGHGNSSGVAPDSPANRTAGTTAGPARGAAGAPPMAGGLAGAPQRGQGEDDIEHKAAPYLEELADVWGEESLPSVAPPVIGDDRR